MNTPHNVKRIIARAVLSGGVAAAGLGLAVGSAQADPQSQGPFQWCPGQPVPGDYFARVPGIPPMPPSLVAWDMSVCHTYWRTPAGRGNVPWQNGGTSNFWVGVKSRGVVYDVVV
jgi:hypothetical protein